MDVDAILARKPQLVLVDEIAHTNVPGSRNEKRWQDVNELLEAGIDVVTTLNMQHLESVNDVVERITGIKQHETIPDAIVRAAEQVELVDMTPEALRRRMAHGNIYPPERIDASLANYFRPGNLAALRELALLWVADKVDETLQDYMDEHGIRGPWETRERVVVAITGAPGGRRAHPARGADGDARARRALRRARALHRRARRPAEAAPRRASGAADRTGRHVPRDRRRRRRQGSDRVRAGRERHPAHPRCQPAVALGRAHAGIGDQPGDPRVRPDRRPRDLERGTGGRSSVAAVPEAGGRSRSGVRSPAPWSGVVVLPLLTLVMAGMRDSLGLPGALLLYLLAVVAIAAIGGMWPALGASVGGIRAGQLVLHPSHPRVHDPRRRGPDRAGRVPPRRRGRERVRATSRRDDRPKRRAPRAEAETLARLGGQLMVEEDPLPAPHQHAAHRVRPRRDRRAAAERGRMDRRDVDGRTRSAEPRRGRPQHPHRRRDGAGRGRAGPGGRGPRAPAGVHRAAGARRSSAVSCARKRRWQRGWRRRTTCGPRSSPRCRTICGRRCRRSRPRPPACCSRTSTGRPRRRMSSSRRSTRRPTGSTRWSATCST